jgi:hypothetical protein
MLDPIHWSYGKRGAVGKNRIGLFEGMKHKDGKKLLISMLAKGKSPRRCTKAGLITGQKMNCHIKDTEGLYNWHL